MKLMKIPRLGWESSKPLGQDLTMCSYDDIFCKNYKRYFNCHQLTGRFYSDFTCIVCHISFHDLLNIIIFVGEADMRIHRVWV